MKEEAPTIEEALNIVGKEPTVWKYLEIRNHSFYYRVGDTPVFLSSFNKKDLPESSSKLTFLGKVLTTLSHFANIMSRRPGTEEVTFYALIDCPQPSILGRKVDQKMLDIAAPSLNWRREKIQKIIRKKVETFIIKNKSFLFIDIGCGAGFDSLEIERIMNRIKILTDGSTALPRNMSINIDIDIHWLKVNKILTETIFGERKNIVRENISASDFLSDKKHSFIFKQYESLIVSCNGFAEFLNDSDLIKLYANINNLVEAFPGDTCVILPFANKNKKQETIGKKIGFQYQAKDNNEMIALCEQIFKNYDISYLQKYSQVVILAEK